MTDVYLKHVRYRDVCIYVPKLRVFNGVVKANRCEFFNMGFDKPYPMNLPTKVEIRPEDLANWRYAFQPNRSGPWKQFPEKL